MAATVQENVVRFDVTAESVSQAYGASIQSPQITDG